MIEMTRRFVLITLEGSNSAVSMVYGLKDGPAAGMNGILQAVQLTFIEDNQRQIRLSIA